MWKLFIADDETIIRKGLKSAIDWDKFSIEVVGEAEDGEQALEMANQLQPDLLFLDICMPFLNGLDLIKQLESQLPHSLFILITGHDEFSYAQQAVRLKVFDYLLKPVNVVELEEVTEKAIESLKSRHAHQKKDKQFEGKRDLLKVDFLLKWIRSTISYEEYQESSTLFLVQLEGTIGILVVKVLNIDLQTSEQFWTDELLAFSARNIINDLLIHHPFVEVIEDHDGHVVVLYPAENVEEVISFKQLIMQKIESFIGKNFLYSEHIADTIEEIPYLYKKAIAQLESDAGLSPIVVLAKNYIEKHYADPDISLNEVADNVQVSPSYLSKRFKVELGLSFIQYLTKIRIDKSLLFMNDPHLKVYEISEMVGYSTQHYFSNAFKKMVGISPSSYRRGSRK